MISRTLIRALALTALLLLLFEGGIRLLVGFNFFADAVEINSPSVLRTKLDAIQRAPGFKVVVLGDSLVYGHAMAEAGDADWRMHTIPSLIRNKLESGGVRSPYVSNFGMNGLLPRDIESLVPAFVAVKPDVVMFDLTLRSFSRDFAPVSAQESRPWIRNYSNETPNSSLLPEKFLGMTGVFFSDSYIVKVREFILSRLFDGSIKDLVGRAIVSLNNSRANELPAELLLMMRAKQRYTDIDLYDDNPQWQALIRTLTHLAESHQRTIIFYATENPDILPSLMDPVKHTAMIDRLEKTIISLGGGCVVFAPPLKKLIPEDFIDHVHLNYQGNIKLSADLQLRIEQLLKEPC